MHLVETLGYFASGAVFLTFWMKVMVPLRILGLVSNILFFSYGFYEGLTPILLLHGCLFPLNALRLHQALNLKRRIHEMAHSNFDVKLLLPLMTERKFSKDQFLFKRGDKAHDIFFLLHGKAHVKELDIDIEPGILIGEIGMFSPDKERTQSIQCTENCVFLSIDEATVLQTYSDNPEFGLFLIKMIVTRLLTNMNTPIEQAAE